MVEYQVNADIAAGRLRSLFTDSIRPQRTITAYYPRAKRLPARTEVFLAFMKRYLRTRLT